MAYIKIEGEYLPIGSFRLKSSGGGTFVSLLGEKTLLVETTETAESIYGRIKEIEAKSDGYKEKYKNLKAIMEEFVL